MRRAQNDGAVFVGVGAGHHGAEVGCGIRG
jgi:hypothetical protein